MDHEPSHPSNDTAIDSHTLPRDDPHSSDSDYDEVLTCSVCDRAFITARQLLVHQNNRKHFGCSKCDLTFSCVQELRDHKDKLDHWSDLDDEEADASNGDVNQDRGEKKQQIDSCNNGHVSEDGPSHNQLHGCFSTNDEFGPSLAEMERLL